MPNDGPGGAEVSGGSGGGSGSGVRVDTAGMEACCKKRLGVLLVEHPEATKFMCPCGTVMLRGLDGVWGVRKFRR